MCLSEHSKNRQRLANKCIIYCEVPGKEAIYRFLELFANHSQTTVFIIPTYVACNIYTHIVVSFVSTV